MSEPYIDDSGQFPFLIYSTLTGEILRSGVESNVYNLPNEAGEDEDWLPVRADDRYYYVDLDTKEVLLRPMIDLPELLTLVPGQEATMDFPPGTSVRDMSGTWILLKDGQLPLAFAFPTKVKMWFRPPFPIREGQVMIKVQDV